MTVVGGGIHGLIYAIHARKAHPEANLRISLFEKAPRPQWKVNVTPEGKIILTLSLTQIGESTLPYFAQWTKSAGMTAEVGLYLLRTQ